MRILNLIILFMFVCVNGYTAQNVVRIAPLTIDIVSTETSIAGSAEKVPNTALVGRESVVIYNADHATETVHCGDSSVTSSSGIPLDSTTPAISLDLDASVDVYCISDGTAVSMRTLETK